MTREDVEKMTDAELANASARYFHKQNHAEDTEDWAGANRFGAVLEMIEDERGRRAGRELGDGE